MSATVQLSRREREVAALVADGLSNREIAERLFISERTAEGHVEQILNKLGFNKRSQVAAWVAREQPGQASRSVPRPVSSLVGRATEIDAVTSALREARLVTITGPGGIGKTRLALEAAGRIESAYRDGAWFVELDSATDAQSVAAAVAHAVRMPQRATNVDEELVRFVGQRDALLVLDNCEHVLDASRALVTALLTQARRLRVLATSRERLGIAGERLVTLGPLQPESDALELFVQRCDDVAAAPLSDADRAVAATICRRLDGIPLAIELAAAQTQVLSMAGIVERLGDRFGLLKSTGQAPSARHQALETTVDWSYQLLPPREADAFRKLSVFRGGFDLDAAEAVLGSATAPDSPLDVVRALVRKSLLGPRDERTGERRFHMLETLREFAARRLEESGDTARVRDRHAGHYLGLSRKAFASLRSRDSELWVQRLDLERGNLSAALDHLMGVNEAAFVTMVAALGRYWIRGRVRDGYRWTERAMRLPAAADTKDVDLLEAWAWLTWQSAMPEPAFVAIDRMLDVALSTGDDATAGRALNMLATFRSDLRLAVDATVWTRAEEHLRRAGQDWPLALLLNDMGWVSAIGGDPSAGLPRIIEGLELARHAGDLWLIAMILDSLAWAHTDLGHVADAVAAWTEGISLTVAAADRYPLPNHLEGFARVARLEGDYKRASVLLGAAAAVRGGVGARPLDAWTTYMQADVDLSRKALGDEVFEASWRAGAAMSAEEAVEVALERVRSGTSPVPDAPPLEVSGS